MVKKIKKILIANRGEIACRLIKTAKKMGIKTVAVYSEADSSSLHIRKADEAIYIGPSPATQSYLNQKAILNAIKMSGADSVHPGYGFLAENPEFAELMSKNNINFIGPSADAIRKMGDKIQAKKIAQSASVNVIPGYISALRTEKQALKIASKIGYPIMLKAAAGGGGKGIRIVKSKEEMQQAFRSTKNEAKNNFDDPRTFIEKFIENPRHIEIQVIADKYGNYVCLGERECSIQRHHQKVIEEAPSAFMDEKTRKKMYAQSIALAKKVKYFSAGTIEYMMDEKKKFYFLEMNTRLQVEHAVTELITGIDIVEQMIRIAEGYKLPFKQKDIKLNGWAIESRIYAEDPSSGFIPSTGRITNYKEPEISENVRVDSSIYEGGEVSMFYDAMIAKLCSYAKTREDAIKLMNDLLGEYVIRGISHNISFLQAVLDTERFKKADISTNFIDDEYSDGFSGADLSDEQSIVMLCTAVHIGLTDIKRSANISGQLPGEERAIGTRWVVRLDEKNYPVTARPIDDGYKITFENTRFYITSKWVLGSKLFQCKINSKQYNLQIEHLNGTIDLTYMGSRVKAVLFTPRAAELNKFMKKTSASIEIQKDLIANISGVIVDIKVKENEEVTKAQPLAVVEAMKMENILMSQIDGIIKKVNFTKGQTVSTGDIIIEIEPKESEDK